MNCVILGAGRTGRGFIARLLHGQAQICFIDKDRALIDALNKTRRYTIGYFEGGPADEIGGYQALSTQDARCRQALERCDAVFVSVRGENGAEAGAWLEEQIDRPVCVIACENAAVPARLLGGKLQNTAASGAVFCTTVESGPLDILSERYPSLHVSRHGTSPAVSALRGIAVEPDFDTLMTRKIYTYNGASALIAYLGAALGITSYAQAARDARIEPVLDAFYAATGSAISIEYGTAPEEQRAFALFSKRKFQNESISDSVGRNAASPERKLAPGERVMGPARLIEKHGGDLAPSARTAAAALRYMGLTGRGEAQDALVRICKCAPGEPLFDRILSAFEASAP